MKLSELIKKLQGVQKLNGDKDVVFQLRDLETGNFGPIVFFQKTQQQKIDGKTTCVIVELY